ncbi:MAG: apolipoprotein N-acyltransferase [Acidobacteria bacterium]|nr:apolipoprotein N-acyltransferase [Acidobacteriota bacterium]
MLKFLSSRFGSIKSPSLSLAPEDMPWQSAMAFVSALLLILSFPGFSQSYLAWVALAPLLNVIAGGVSIRRALWLGWLTGVIFTFFAENWIAHSMTHYGDIVTGLAYLIAFFFASILAIFPAIFAAAMSVLVRSLGWWAMVLAPVVWVATEWLRPQITGVTWNALGISQVDQYAIARLSQFGGVYLVSAEVVSVSALIILGLKLREKNVGKATALLLLLAIAALALPRMQNTPRALGGAMITAVGVQPNLPLNASDSSESFSKALDENIRLTREAIEKSPDKSADIVVWAESPLSLFYENDPVVKEKLDGFARDIGSYLIINTVTRQGQSYLNSINTISPREIGINTPSYLKMRRYDKIRLVPFGEFVPWRPLLGRLVPAITGDFTPGKDTVVNQLKLETRRAAIISGTQISPREGIERTTSYARVGSFICYESAYPDIVRRFVKNGATLLVNVSNDSWFGNTAGANQHLAHAMMRAIENDRDMLRVTNTGITALITADGQVIEPLQMFTSGSHFWQAQLNRRLTFYSVNGDWFAAGCSIFSILILLFSLAGNKFSVQGHPPGTE